MRELIGFLACLLVSLAAHAVSLQQIDLLVDADGKETIDTVFAGDPGRFIPIDGAGYAGGYTHSVHWFRIRVEAPAGDWVLEALPPTFNDIRLYEPDGRQPGVFRERRQGDGMPFAARDYDYRGFAFRLTTEHPGPHTYYLRVSTTKSSSLLLRAWEPESFRARASLEYGLLMAGIAIIVTVMLLNLSTWFWLRDPLTAWFILYILSASILFAANAGFLSQFLYPNSATTNTLVVSISGLLAMSLGQAFYRRQFGIDRRRPILNGLYRIAIAIPLLGCAAVFAGYPMETIRTSTAVTLPITLIGLVLAAGQWRAGMAGGAMMFAANVFSLAGSIAFVLFLRGYITPGIWVIHSFQIASIGVTLVLHLAISERYRALRDAQISAELEAANERSKRLQREEFFTNMSHEIRTPLNGILGLARIGYRNSGAKTKAQEMFSRILDSGQLLLSIINDILDFSKIEAGKLMAESIPYAPAELCQSVVARLQPLASDEGIQLIGEAHDLPSACLGDPGRITQILTNLLSNGIKFTPSGEVKLSARREGKDLIFDVTDTGIGIAPADMSRLFQPFEQLDSSTTRKFGGTGLGLAISRHLAELMQGQLTATSVVGRGSTFTLRLPLVEATGPVARAHSDPGQRPARLAGLRILVAEDNAVNQLVTGEYLTIEGATYEIVGNGQEAIDAVTHGTFDVILMDVQMPVMDGEEATRQLRQNHPGLPVIGLTAHAIKEQHENYLAAGMSSVVTKPVELDAMVAAILSCVGRPTALDAVAMDSEPATPATEDTAPELPHCLIDWDHVLKTVSIHHLLGVFVEAHREDAATLRNAAATADYPAIERTAHKLKGSAGHLKANEICHLAQVVNDLASTRNPDALAQAPVLADLTDTLLDEVRNRKDYM